MKDVVLTCFSSSSIAPANKFSNQYFKDPPITLSIPGNGGNDFRAKVISWCKSGDLFRAALKELSPQNADIEIGKRGLVTFSAGWSAADEIFKFEAEIERLSAYLLLDGCHTENLNNWIKFATKAANNDAFMVCAHSSIIPPFISSTTTNKKIFEEACKINLSLTDKPLLTGSPPDYIVNANFSPPITISVGATEGMKAESKMWGENPLLDWESRGNLTRLHYSGDGRCDHILIAQYIQPLLWRWLGEEWS